MEDNTSTTTIISTTTPNLLLAASSLNYATMLFIRCYCFVVIPLGMSGHLMSVYVFTRRTLIVNPCSTYFLAATIVGIVNTCYTLPMRLLQSGFVDTDPGARSAIFCKLTWLTNYSIRYVDSIGMEEIRTYCFVCRGICPWLVVLACCDRYLSSCASATRRAWSDVRVANRAVFAVILIGFLIHVHIPIFFQIDIIPASQKPICYPPGPPGTYRIIFSFFNLFYVGLLPSLAMLLFGLLSVKNVERSKRLLVAPSTTVTVRGHDRNWKINRHMFRMLFLQVLVYCTTGLTYAISAIYTAVHANQPKNVFQVAQENMITVSVGILSNTGPCLSFYLFTLSSSLFRRELTKLFVRCKSLVKQTPIDATRWFHTDHGSSVARV